MGKPLRDLPLDSISAMLCVLAGNRELLESAALTRELPPAEKKVLWPLLHIYNGHEFPTAPAFRHTVAAAAALQKASSRGLWWKHRCLPFGKETLASGGAVLFLPADLRLRWRRPQTRSSTNCATSMGGRSPT